MKASKPPNEPQRMDALHRYEILDTTPEQEYDDITLLASQICGTPIALISLVDENRQWFKSKVGTSENETPRDIAFCAHGILQDDVFVVEDARADPRFASNPIVTGKTNIQFYAGSPLITPDGQKLGMLCVNDHKPRKLSVDQKMALQSLSRQVVTLLELRLNTKKLKESIIEREKVTHQLMDVSRRAGMFEVASNVLHNLGNILNSVITSSSVIAEQIRALQVDSIGNVIALLEKNKSILGDFFTKDKKGKQLLEYLVQFEVYLKQAQDDILHESDLLSKNIEHIRLIVLEHQNYGKMTGVLETFKITDLFQDALSMSDELIKHRDIKILYEFNEVPPISAEKHKLLQIIVNLISNAIQSFDNSKVLDKKIILRVESENEYIKASVIDNGIGIPSANLTQIFNQGFTTKKNGHGYGLHGSCLLAKELGGKLTASSEGVGLGATFVLIVPIQEKESNQ